MDLDRIAAKVQKLLRLAQSPNEHEAARARERAQELIDRYGPAVLAEPVATVDDAPWVHDLTGLIAHYMLCEVEDDTKGNLFLAGASTDIADARALLEYLGPMIFGFAQRQFPHKLDQACNMCVGVLTWQLQTDGQESLDDAERPAEVRFDPLALTEQEATWVADFWQLMLRNPPGALDLSFTSTRGMAPIWVVQEYQTRTFVQDFFGL